MSLPGGNIYIIYCYDQNLKRYSKKKKNIINSLKENKDISQKYRLFFLLGKR